MKTRYQAILTLTLGAVLMLSQTVRANPDYDALIAAAERSADAAAAELKTLTDVLSVPLETDAQVTERFEKLAAMLDTIAASIGEGSDNRALVDRLITEAEAEQNAMLEQARITQDKEFHDYAARWAKTKERLYVVREGLIAEDDETKSLRAELALAEIKVRQELKLAGAEAAAAKLEKVRARLQEMNDSLRQLVESTRKLNDPVPSG